MWYTSGMNILIISFLCLWQWTPGQIIAYSNYILNFITFLLQFKSVFLLTIIVVNEVSQGVLLILMTSFRIPHVNTTMHAYTVFTFLIVVYIPTNFFSLNPHSIFLKKGNSSCSVYNDKIV